MKKGYFALVLHSHLPYVLNHGSWPHGTDWLFEAAAETYIPLLMELERLKEKGITPRVTMGITPILMEQLSSLRFQNGFISYLQKKIDLAHENLVEFRQQEREHLAFLAQYWIDFFSSIKDYFQNRCQQDLLARFRKLQDQGAIEVITCGATHGYFPLLGTDESIYAQVKVGKEIYRKYMGRDPVGIWLPECAYRPSYLWESPLKDYQKKFHRKGIEEFLYENDIRYFIVDAHLIKGGSTRGVYIDRFESLKHLWQQFSAQWHPKEEIPRSVYRNYLVASSDETRAAVVYGRDDKTGLQVWSGEWGYPGDGNYLEFHKKHFPGGHRYWRVTSSDADLADKQEYHPEWVEEVIENQSSHFVQLIEKYLLENYQETGEAGILTAPFDTELFGHWWFEGPRWLGKVLEKLWNSEVVETISLGAHLKEHPPEGIISLPEGSWGQGGFHYIWLNQWTEWTWRHIYQAEEEMVRLTEKYLNTNDKTIRRIMNQLARELLLMESSDWQFLISTWSARDYAENRISYHVQIFQELQQMLAEYVKSETLSSGNLKRLETIEDTDRVFEEIDFRYWKKIEEK